MFKIEITGIDKEITSIGSKIDNRLVGTGSECILITAVPTGSNGDFEIDAGMLSYSDSEADTLENALMLTSGYIELLALKFNVSSAALLDTIKAAITKRAEISSLAELFCETKGGQ